MAEARVELPAIVETTINGLKLADDNLQLMEDNISKKTR